MKNTALAAIILALLAGMFAYTLVHPVIALPAGATIVSNSTSGAPSSTASSRNDSRSTITTIILSSVQQDDYWKAYVGNITGRLSLDDANSYTIYDWPISLNLVGEVYISRHSSPTFGSIGCANTINVSNEELYYGMTAIQADNINKTFNLTNHQQFAVGPTNILANTCKSTATYRNDTGQSMNGNQVFQEILLQDSSNFLIYTTLINATTAGYNNNPYDFQILVPESLANASTIYYFFTELG